MKVGNCILIMSKYGKIAILILSHENKKWHIIPMSSEKKDTLKSRPTDGFSLPQRIFRLLFKHILFISYRYRKYTHTKSHKKNNLGDQAELIYQYISLVFGPSQKSLCEKILGLPNFGRWVRYPSTDCV